MGRATGETDELDFSLTPVARFRQSQEQTRQRVADDELDGFWYHATGKRFEQFNFKLRRDRRNTGDWSALLGVHFSRDGEGARKHFLYGDKGRVIEAQLRLERPIRYGDEYEFERLAFRLLQADLGYSDKMLAMKVHPGTRSPLGKRLRQEFLEYLDGSGWREPRGHRYFLNRDEHISRVARLVRAELQAQGYDSVLYGNSFDFHCVSAIVFEPAQIEIVDHDWHGQAQAAA